MTHVKLTSLKPMYNYSLHYNHKFPGNVNIPACFCDRYLRNRGEK
jgi:hypothetical protein